MLTIFAVPKAFRGQFKVIQTNAIRSWTMLQPTPEIILFGDEEGVREIAKGLGLRHVPTIERNRWGTPLVSYIFKMGQVLASNDTVCYVNSDIILMSDFMQAVKSIVHVYERCPFLLVGRKLNIEMRELVDFSLADWEPKVKHFAKSKGKYVTYDSDFFVFPKGMYEEIPPFAIGRCFWTPWLIFNARIRGIPVIDATAVVTAVESRHDYSHARSTGGAKRLSGTEYLLNQKLFKGCKYFTTLDASLILTSAGGLSRPPIRNRFLSLWTRLEYWIYFLLKATLYPYSLPLILLLRGLRGTWETISSLFKAVGRLAQ